MVHINYSTDISKLIDGLFDRVKSSPCFKDPFYSPEVIIPNNNISKFISLYKTDRNRICFNLNFCYLENVLSDLLSGLYPAYKNIEFLGHKKNHFLLINIIYSIISGDIDRQELLMIKNYIDNSKAAEKTKKIWQLSEKLCSLFREYEYKKKELVSSWISLTLTDKKNESEKFQAYVYNKIFNARDGILSKETDGIKYTSLFLYFDEIACKENLKMTEKRDIHIFCLSNISNLHYEIINFLSRHHDFYFYNLNYSGKYSGQYFHSYKMINADDENFKQISLYLPDHKASCISGKTASGTMLKSMQNLLLTQAGKESKTDIVKDDTVNFMSAQSIYREVETVYNSIIFNLNNDSLLKLNEIAVLTPDLNKYRPFIAYVFNKNKKIEYSLIDSNAGQDSVYGQAALSLLKIINGGFTRKNAFDLFLNECFYKKIKLSYDQIQSWLDICSKNNIFNNYDDKSNFSWIKGIERILLGKIMNGIEEEHLSEDTAFFANLIPYSDINTSDIMISDPFIMTIYDFISGIKSFKTVSDTGIMIDGILKMIDRYLTPETGDNNESPVKDNLFNSLKELKKTSGINMMRENVTLDLIIEETASILESISTGKGSYLSKGINVSQLMPMRPIPFKIIYILGMNEKDFPGHNDNSLINLINYDRLKNGSKIPGYLPQAEINLLSFIEIILTVKDRLYLSYISKDIEKDSVLYPSIIYKNLMDFINSRLKEGSITADCVNLNSENPRAADSAYKEKDIHANYDLQTRLLSLKKLFLTGALNNDEMTNKLKVFEEQFDFSIKNTAKTSGVIKTILRLRELKSFIENPMETKIKKTLNIYDEIEKDDTEIEDEPFSAGSLSKYIIENGALMRHLLKKNDPQKFFNNYFEYSMLAGNLPEKAFGNHEKYSILENLDKNIRSSEFVLLGDKLKDASFYSDKQPDMKTSLPFLTFNINVQGVDFTVKSEIKYLWRNNKTFHTLVLMNNPVKKDIIGNKYFIEPFLYYLSLIISGYDPEAFNFHVFFKKTNSHICCVFNEYNMDKAVLYFTDLIKDYIFNDDFYNLPIEAVDKNILSAEKKDIPEMLEDSINNLYDSDNFSQFRTSDAFKLIKNVLSFKPKDPSSLINDRIKPVLKYLTKEKA